MAMQTWVAFAAAAAIILVIPGPTIILVIGRSLAHGRKAALPLVAGVALGDFTAMTLSLIGLGAVMAASAALFTVLKYAGAAYLIWLGIGLWRSAPDAAIAAGATGGARSSLFSSAYVVTALNPKSIVFFVAFMPQFVDSAAATGGQLVLLGATFLVLATINATLYAIFAGQYLKTCD